MIFKYQSQDAKSGSLLIPSMLSHYTIGLLTGKECEITSLQQFTP
jgi:hypothetical protein